MKKLVSILMALLMLVMCAASAETFVLADPVLTVNTGEAMTLDLTGLELAVTTGQAGDIPAVQLDVNGKEGKLMGVAMNVIGTKVVFAIDGGSSVYSVEIPAEAIESVSNFDMSNVNIDTEALSNVLMNGIEMTDDSIKVPYTTVNEALEIVAPALADVNIPGLDVSQLTDAIAELKQSDSGISLEGSYKETETGLSANLALIPVENGQASEMAMNISVEANNESVAVSLEVPGQAELYFAASPADENTVGIALGGSAEGSSLDLTAIAKVVESDVELTAIQGAENAIDVVSMTDEQREAMVTEFSGAAMGLIGYLFTAMGAAA